MTPHFHVSQDSRAISMRATRTCILASTHYRMRWTFPTFPDVSRPPRNWICAPKPSDNFFFFLAYAHERIATDNENRNLVGDVVEDRSNLFGYPWLNCWGEIYYKFKLEFGIWWHCYNSIYVGYIVSMKGLREWENFVDFVEVWSRFIVSCLLLFKFVIWSNLMVIVISIQRNFILGLIKIN